MKAVALSIFHVITATVVYWHLITGGWLTNHYQLNDPNIVNLVLAIFEPIAVVRVIAWWLCESHFSTGSSRSCFWSKSSLAPVFLFSFSSSRSPGIRK
jgi:hypothetical protein